ncbi:hypothetical protein Salat_2932700 [Sesamum alatum]|uniref:Uncharacterized protein n=1 Tax=Sesamum alatum TaxID=300844 RepID=A0AAE1XJ23_9LAMI|nr:hypothetical protein Salat_2932700 [Sesamum alatum]
MLLELEARVGSAVSLHSNYVRGSFAFSRSRAFLTRVGVLGKANSSRHEKAPDRLLTLKMNVSFSRTQPSGSSGDQGYRSFKSDSIYLRTLSGSPLLSLKGSRNYQISFPIRQFPIRQAQQNGAFSITRQSSWRAIPVRFSIDRDIARPKTMSQNDLVSLQATLFRHDQKTFIASSFSFLDANSSCLSSSTSRYGP